jgi:CheY-like chemotaxis protein
MPSGTDQQKTSSIPACVLVVEDNVIIAMSAEEQLLELGVDSVVVAYNVAEAEQICASRSFDFALLDYELGRDTSVTVARRLQAMAVPFAFASGFGEMLELPEDLHGSLILKKPYFLSDLERTLQAHKTA